MISAARECKMMTDRVSLALRRRAFPRKVAILYLLAICLSGCAGHLSQQPVDMSTVCADVSCKDTVKAHLKSAKKKLESDAQIGKCRVINRWNILTSHPAPLLVVDTRFAGHSTETLRMSAFTVANASHWFFLDDESAGDRAIAALLDWARSGAHGRFHARNDRSSSAAWPSYGLMASVLNSLFLLDDHPSLTADARDEILRWVRSLLDRTWIFGDLPDGGAGFGNFEQRVNNHNARRGLILLYWGLLTNDLQAVGRSSAVIARSLSAFDKYDVPYDANRGDRALRYVNFALDSIVMHHSFLQIVGGRFDPRTIRKIDQAAKFLFEEAANPDRIHPYAAANIGRGGGGYQGSQDQSWLWERDGGFTWWSYVDTEFFRDHMKDGSEALSRSRTIPAGIEAVKYSETGGLVTCWFPH
jgi:hypothetical protein